MDGFKESFNKQLEVFCFKSIIIHWVVLQWWLFGDWGGVQRLVGLW
jgi:hypothetical protein